MDYTGRNSLSKIFALIKNALDAKSDAAHKHSASDITSGALVVSRGGTGGTTVPEARKNLSMAACAKSTNSDLSLTAGTITTVPLNSITTSKSAIICSNGGVRCPYDGMIIVSGNVYYSAHGGTYACFIYKNDTEVVSQTMTVANAWRSITSGMAVISVNAGDIIYLKARSVGGAGTVVCNNAGTQLNIAYV